MSSQQQTAYEFANLQGFLNLLVSIIEGAAWAMFGTSIIWQMGFCAWAVAMVWVRPYLFQTQYIAIQKGNEQLATKISWLIRVSMIVTCFSLFSLGWEAFDEYKQNAVENSPQRLLAQSRVEQAQATLESLQASNPYSPEQLASAGFEKSQLEAELQTARAAAQASQQRQLSAIQNELDRFWNQKATNSLGQNTGKTVRQMLGGRCPGGSFYHRKYCPQLTTLKGKAPIVETAQEQRLTTDLSNLSGAIAYKSRLDNAKLVLAEVEQELFAIASDNSNIEYLPPAFHRAASMLQSLGAKNITADVVASFIIILAILLILNSQGIFQVARQMIFEDNKEIERKPTLFEKVKTWLKQRKETRATEEPLVEPATVTATAKQPLKEKKEEGVGYDETKIGFRTTSEKPKAGDTAICPQCGQSFVMKNYRHTYCGEACRLAGNGVTSKAQMLANKKHGIKA